MNRKYKALALGLFVVIFAACLPLTAMAAGETEAIAVSATVSTNVFDGFKVTVTDKTTPAVNMRGRLNDRTVMCFVSAADLEIGVISYADYLAIIEKNKKVVQLEGGGTLATPPGGYGNWHEWFADEFNKYRGLAAGTREEAAAVHTDETIEEYRQELIRLVNLEREKAGLPAYIVNDIP